MVGRELAAKSPRSSKGRRLSEELKPTKTHQNPPTIPGENQSNPHIVTAPKTEMMHFDSSYFSIRYLTSILTVISSCHTAFLIGKHPHSASPSWPALNTTASVLPFGLVFGSKQKRNLAICNRWIACAGAFGVKEILRRLKRLVRHS